jgi:hypothetical protein
MQRRSVVEAVFEEHYAQRGAETGVWGGKLVAKLMKDDEWGLVERLIVFFDQVARASEPENNPNVTRAWEKVVKFIDSLIDNKSPMVNKYDLDTMKLPAGKTRAHNIADQGYHLTRSGRYNAHEFLKGYLKEASPT